MPAGQSPFFCWYKQGAGRGKIGKNGSDWLVLAVYIAIGVILVIFFLLLNIEVVVKYQENGDENGLFLEVFYLNRWLKKEYSYTDTGFRLRRFVPFIRVKKEVEKESGDEIYEQGLLIRLRRREYLGKVLDIKRKLDEIPLLKNFYFRTLEVKELRWETRIGSVDAMQTGLLAGEFGASKGSYRLSAIKCR